MCVSSNTTARDSLGKIAGVSLDIPDIFIWCARNKDIRARLQNVEDDKAARHEAASANKEAL